MGLLTGGSPLSWEETKKYARHVKRNGILQFINMLRAASATLFPDMTWGDEIEYTAVCIDRENKEVRVALVCSDILPTLQEDETKNPDDCLFIWRPEFADYLIEGIPGKPYTPHLSALLTIEASLKSRRHYLAKVLSDINPDLKVFTISTFPRLGCTNFTEPKYGCDPDGKFSQSIFYPDEAINRHPRMRYCAKNIRERKGKKVEIHVPVYLDKFTNPKSLFPPDLTDTKCSAVAKPGHIYMDAMGFGMGCGCLQITYQCRDLTQARYLYDQLAIMGPILLALSACSPAFHGYLSEYDCRWNVIANAVDDRTELEYKDGRIRGSRFGVIDCYSYTDVYNDVPIATDEESYATLTAAGIDPALAKHISHLFIRDPLILYEEYIEQDNAISSNHFENINSTNWNNVRLKPPPIGSGLGWRVEFRPLDIQMTDYENTSFMVFAFLLNQVILKYNLNLYIPISKLHENMETAQLKDAYVKHKFWFNANIYTKIDATASTSLSMLSCNDIINGRADFPGLLVLVREYLAASKELSQQQKDQLGKYLDLIEMRARGDSITDASWMRTFIMTHPSYKRDSFIPAKSAYDLFLEIHRMNEFCEYITYPELFGRDDVKQVSNIID